MKETTNIKNPSYLSIVLCGRNDNYGGDFIARLQRSLNYYIKYFNYYKIRTELVFVNYNPVPENPPITALVKWPSSEWVSIKIITVPPAVHQSLTDEKIRKTYPVFEFIAKNIGIRRATGKFILATNADILFSKSLFEFLAQKSLQSKVLYRCDRLDFKAKKIGSDFNEENIYKNIFKVYMQGGTFTKYFPLPTKHWINLCRKYNAFRKFVYSKSSRSKILTSLPVFNQVKKQEFFLFNYPCNASGDFTLLDKKSWNQLSGYPEDTWSSAHPDSLFLMRAVHSNIKIKLLDTPIYHQDHARRFDFSLKNPDIQKMYDRLLNEAEQMQENKNYRIKNNANWGLVNDNFKMIRI